MDALILTVELAYREILSIEHTEGLDYHRRKCQYAMIIYDAVCITRDYQPRQFEGRYNGFPRTRYIQVSVWSRGTKRAAQLFHSWSISIKNTYRPAVYVPRLELVMSSIQKESEPTLVV